MNSLPPELILQISTFLDAPTLHACSLVSQDLRANAQHLLFSRVVLRHSGGVAAIVARCELLLAEKNHHLVGQIKKLTIEVLDMPIFQDGKVPVPLIALLVKIGPQIDTLRIGGWVYDPEGVREDIRFHSLAPSFRDCLFKHVMPFLRSLDLREMDSLPLITISQSCPVLQHLRIGAKTD
ncbi:hypothetical protein DL96DRAFT_208016 [Flagelloscypha sp. PMI_526]|nr:hypothetical protein DL96DRAFT_208016 [Flagelloscypha sp. PMI_526]